MLEELQIPSIYRRNRSKTHTSNTHIHISNTHIHTSNTHAQPQHTYTHLQHTYTHLQHTYTHLQHTYTRPLTSMAWYMYYDSKSGGVKLIHGPKFTLVYFAVS